MSKRPSKTKEEPFAFSVICWSNDAAVHNEFFGLSFETAKWYGNPVIDPVVILPIDRARNMGHAYNMARTGFERTYPDGTKEWVQAKYPTRIYMHQDVQLQDRSLGYKLWELLNGGHGIGAVGPLGATIDTGGGYWFCHPRFQVGNAPDLSSGQLVMLSDARPLKVLDGIFLATNQDIEWSEEYEGTHMFIEDMCMRIRARGLAIWSVDTWLKHKGSQAQLGNAYWRSNIIFRQHWEPAFENIVPPLDLFQAFIEQYRIHTGLVHRDVARAGMYDIVWQTWFHKLDEERRAATKSERRELVHA